MNTNVLMSIQEGRLPDDAKTAFAPFDWRTDPE